MPWEKTENEIRHRLKDPSQFSECRSKEITSGVRIIYCKRKDSDKWESQAIRFSLDKFDMASARKWFEEHKEGFTESISPDKDMLESEKIEPEDGLSRFNESVEIVQNEGGDNWLITPLKFGKSKREPYFVYTKEAVVRSLNAFDGAPVYINAQADDNGHKTRGSEKVVKDMIGYLSKPNPTDDRLLANLTILPSAKWFKDNLKFLESKGKLNFYQLSIDAYGTTESKEYNGEQLPHAKTFIQVDVDVVQRGAAGGEFNHLLESLQNPYNKNTGAIMEDKEKNQEQEQEKKIKESDPKPEKEKVTPDPTEDIKKLQESMTQLQKQNCANMLEAEIGKSELPIPLQENIRKVFHDKIFTESELKTYITDTKDTYAKMMAGNPRKIFVEAGKDAFDKTKAGMLGLFLDGSVRPPTGEERKKLVGDIPSFRSFKEAYITLTGDREITGKRTSTYRFTEAITTADFDQVAADVMHMALVREYSLMGFDTWRDFADVVPLSDFRTVHRIRYGGYGTLPTVTEKGAYSPLTSPTDEEATYAPTKKGGTEEVTIEMIKNDAVGAIRRIPTRLARAAAYSLWYTIYYTILRPQGAYTIYDSVSLYNAAHPVTGGANVSNTGTTAIATGLDAARILMAKFPEKNSYQPLGIRAGFVLVPPDLEGSAYTLVTTAYGVYNQVPTYLQTQGIKVIPVACWSDATDYAVVARKEDVIGLEVGFLDGKETPELFVSDIPNTGSLFTNDAITFKIRHIWGCAVVDFRAFYGQTVA